VLQTYAPPPYAGDDQGHQRARTLHHGLKRGKVVNFNLVSINLFYIFPIYHNACCIQPAFYHNIQTALNLSSTIFPGESTDPIEKMIAKSVELLAPKIEHYQESCCFLEHSFYVGGGAQALSNTCIT
jgi:hypothetical protein